MWFWGVGLDAGGVPLAILLDHAVLGIEFGPPKHAFKGHKDNTGVKALALCAANPRFHSKNFIRSLEHCQE